MKAKCFLYHVDCFKCVICDVPLIKGNSELEYLLRWVYARPPLQATSLACLRPWFTVRRITNNSENSSLVKNWLRTFMAMRILLEDCPPADPWEDFPGLQAQCRPTLSTTQTRVFLPPLKRNEGDGNGSWARTRPPALASPISTLILAWWKRPSEHGRLSSTTNCESWKVTSKWTRIPTVVNSKNWPPKRVWTKKCYRFVYFSECLEEKFYHTSERGKLWEENFSQESLWEAVLSKTTR